jgi:hypothetical protein
MDITREHIALASEIKRLTDKDRCALIIFLRSLQDSEDTEEPPAYVQEKD